MKIAYSGFFRDPSGLGEAARRMVRALQGAGHEVRPEQPLADPETWHLPADQTGLGDFLDLERHAAPDVHVIHAAATDLPRVANTRGRQVGMVCWETDRLHPSAVAGCKAVDVVLVPSDQTREACEASGVPAAVVRYPVEPPLETFQPVFRAGLLPMKFGISEDTYVFYSVLTWQERKNPTAILTAFMTAFEKEDDVTLVLVVGGRDAGMTRAAQDFEVVKTALNLPNPPVVKIASGKWTTSELWAMHQQWNAYISLSRGEAFCLPLADAWAVGNPVVMTGWGGPMDYAVNAIEVPYRMTPVMQAYPHFDGRQLWADPDVLRAREEMQALAAQEVGKRRPTPSQLALLSPEAAVSSFVEACA